MKIDQPAKLGLKGKTRDWKDLIWKSHNTDAKKELTVFFHMFSMSLKKKYFSSFMPYNVCIQIALFLSKWLPLQLSTYPSDVHMSYFW